MPRSPGTGSITAYRVGGVQVGWVAFVPASLGRASRTFRGPLPESRVAAEAWLAGRLAGRTPPRRRSPKTPDTFPAACFPAAVLLARVRDYRWGRLADPAAPSWDAAEWVRLMAGLTASERYMVYATMVVGVDAQAAAGDMGAAKKSGYVWLESAMGKLRAAVG